LTFLRKIFSSLFNYFQVPIEKILSIWYNVFMKKYSKAPFWGNQVNASKEEHKRRRKMEEKTWKTKDGVEVPIKDLSDNHLLNIIRMLNRASELECFRLICSAQQVLNTLHGEYARMGVEEDIDFLIFYGLDPAKLFPKYNDLVDERQRRGLIQT